MEPKYFVENRYSFVVDALPVIGNRDYEVDTPETAFERDVQRQLAVANRLLMAGQYSTALAKFRHLRDAIEENFRIYCTNAVANIRAFLDGKPIRLMKPRA